MRVFVFGLDCADIRFVERYREDVPTLSALMDEGRFGKLRTVYPPSTAPGWSAFVTGKNAGKSNQLNWGRAMDEDSYRVNLQGKAKVVAPEIWDYVTDAGLTSVVLNMPLTFPVSEVDGCMVSGFDLPSDDVEWTYPKGLKQELIDEFGYSPVEPGRLEELGAEEYLKQYAQHHESLLQVADFLMERYDWDLFMSCFTAVDRVVHKFMKCIDNWEEYAAWGDPVRRMYRLADQYLQKLLRRALSDGEEVAIVVLSDHGARGVQYRFNLNSLLIEEGLATLSEFGEMMRSFGGTGNASLLHKLFDWEETKAWVCPDMLGGGSVYVNDDRFPEGIVTDREAVLKEVRSVLKGWKANIGGGQLVRPIKRVVGKEELYSGPFVEKFPDVICFPMDGWAWDPWVLRTHPFVSTETMGEHDMDGFYAVKAPGVEAGREKSHILDMAPTVLDLLGLEVPSDMDGSSIVGDPGVREPLPSRTLDSRMITGDVEEKLRDLGYI